MHRGNQVAGAPLIPYESRVADPRPAASRHACPKCVVAMEQGFVGSQWVEGSPGQSLRSLAKARRFLVETFRCPQCGLLESYATHPPPESTWSRVKRWRGW